MKKTLCLSPILLILSLTLIVENSASAQSTTVSVINPLTGDSNFKFFTNTTSVGDTFIANITVANVVDLYAWNVHLNFNTTMLNITSTADVFQPSDHVFAGKDTVELLVKLNSSLGSVEFAQSLLGNIPTFSGSGRLAQVRFKITQYPAAPKNIFSYLRIDNSFTFLLDSGLHDIPTTKMNGYYEYQWTPLPPQPWLEVAPTLVEFGPYPPSAIGKHFNITVWLKGLRAAWKLVHITFGLTYDSRLIQSLNATEGPFMKEFGETMFLKSIGISRVDVTSALESPPATYPNGEGALATITFNIIYQGTTPEVKESPIILIGVKLTNKDGKEIPLNTTKIVDGLYRIKSLTPSTIYLIVAPTTVTIGSNVTITGTITPLRAEVDVTIYYRLEGKNWTTLKIVKTNSNGSYTYLWKTIEAGSYQLKAMWFGDAITLSDESDVKNVKVEPPPIDILPYILIATIVVITVIAIGMYYWKVRKPQRLR